MRRVREQLLWLLMGSYCMVLSQGFTVIPSRFSPVRLEASSLYMGLGSFVKKRVLGRDGDDNDGGKNLPRKKVTTPIAKPEAPQPKAVQPVKPPAPTKKTPMPGLQRDPAPQKRAPVSADPNRGVSGPETTQDRINRVKQGKMTDEEKQRFLQSTLKGGMEPKSINPGQLRQPLVEESKAAPRNAPSATPFPRDSMLREVVTGRKDDKSYDEWKDNNKKKKEYFDMVTNPNRFSTFNAAPVPAEPEPISQVVPPSVAPDTSDTISTDISWDPLDETPLDSSSSPLPPDPSSTDADHLGARLEAAAMADEQRQREARKHVEQLREVERVQRIEEQRAREEQQLLQEEENLRKKREAVELSRLDAERKAASVQAKQDQMMQAQEDYWAQKLAGERQRKLAKLSEEDQLVEEERLAEEARQQSEATAQKEANAASRLAQEQLMQELQEQQSEGEPSVPVPQPMPAPAPAPINNRSTLNTPLPGSAGYTGNPFLDEQAQKLAGIEQARADQIAKLKALNSPLPSGRPQGVSPAMQYSRPAPPAPAPPQIVRPTNPAASPATPTRGLSELQRLVNPKKQPEAPRSDDLSVQEIMRQAANARAEQLPPPTPAPARQQSGNDSGFLGRVFGGNKQEEEEEYYDDPIPEQPRKVVRQALPVLEEDEDAEFEAFARGGPNQGMSIGDALKSVGEDGVGEDADQDERSKMWGIDMSRFD